MSELKKRRVLDTLIGMAVFLTIWYAGAGYWAVLIFPFGLWNYYDGSTRSYLSNE